MYITIIKIAYTNALQSVMITWGLTRLGNKWTWMWINIIYFCTDSPFVPTDFKPIIFGSENFYKQVSVKCPLISNPSPVCNWSKYDANNTRHEVVPGKYIGYDAGSNNCSLGFFPLREEHSGLYECTASNTIGSTTYTFPERFIVESKEL